MRQKKTIAELVLSKKPFVYSSGKYSSDYLKTTVVKLLAPHPQRDGALVYDLRYDPTPFAKMSVKQLVAAWKYDPDKSKARLPIKTLQYNRCPAIAPLSVLDNNSRQRIGIDIDLVKENQQRLAEITDWPAKILEALVVMDKIQDHKYAVQTHDIDESLYDGFFGQSDNKLMIKIHDASVDQIRELKPVFEDSRLNGLLPLYIARNFPSTISEAETESWDRYRLAKLTDGEAESRLARFESEISALTKIKGLSKRDREIINQLKLYETSVIS